MAWIYLGELAESDKPSPHGSERLRIAKKTDSQQPFCAPEWRVENCTPPLFGMTLSLSVVLPSTLLAFVKSTLFTVASPARISALQALAQAWEQGREAGFSVKSSDLLANYDPVSSSWKM